MTTPTSQAPDVGATAPVSDSPSGNTGLAVIVDRRELAQVRRIEPMDAGVMTAVIGRGDLSGLTEPQLIAYYENACNSMGLNPVTRPLEFIEFYQDGQKKLVLYIKAWAADQLRNIHKVAFELDKTRVWEEEDILFMEMFARLPDGREDTAVAGLALLVEKKGPWIDTPNNPRSKGYYKKTGEYERIKGMDRANLRMKLETKVKRRLTLSICGLGWLNEEDTGIADASIARIVEAPETGDGPNHERAILAAPAPQADPLMMNEPSPKRRRDEAMIGSLAPSNTLTSSGILINGGVDAPGEQPGEASRWQAAWKAMGALGRKTKGVSRGATIEDRRAELTRMELEVSAVNWRKELASMGYENLPEVPDHPTIEQLDKVRAYYHEVQFAEPEDTKTADDAAEQEALFESGE